MPKSFNTRTGLRLALVAAAAISVTACSSKPKPNFPTTTTPTQTTPRPGPTTAPPTGVGNQPLGALPGSQADFVQNVGERIFFDYDQYGIRDDAMPVLDAQASWLRRYPAVRVRIEGNTDEMGTREYNLALGARRANAVRDYLVAKGVTGDRIATVSFGKEQPIDGGASDESHAKNRNARTALVGGAR